MRLVLELVYLLPLSVYKLQELLLIMMQHLVGLGDLSRSKYIAFNFWNFVTVILMTKGVKGGVFYGMIITIIVGMIFGLIDVPDKIVDKVPSIAPTFGAVICFF